MEVQVIKTDLHKIIDNIQDAQLLQAVYEILRRQDSSKDIVGFTPDGSPITKEQYIKDIKEATERVKAGHFITQEDVEKEMEKW